MLKGFLAYNPNKRVSAKEVGSSFSSSLFISLYSLRFKHKAHSPPFPPALSFVPPPGPPQPLLPHLALPNPPVQTTPPHPWNGRRKDLGSGTERAGSEACSEGQEEEEGGGRGRRGGRRGEWDEEGCEEVDVWMRRGSVGLLFCCSLGGCIDV